MRKSLILGIALALTASTVSAAPAGKTTKGGDVRAFDGKWSIEVITERGDCDKAYRYGIRIENGEARYDGGTDFDVSGKVTGAGAVKGSISRGDNRADVIGTLSGGFGTGTWTTSGSSSCGGRWVAERRA